MNKDRLKFRGFCINGEPVVGFLTIIENGNQTLEPGCYISNLAGAPFAYRVCPEILEQSIGLRDKNNTLIFGGDIVHFYCEDGFYRCRVVWSEKNIQWAFRIIKNYSAYCNWSDFETDKIEVVGNIHEGVKA